MKAYYRETKSKHHIRYIDRNRKPSEFIESFDKSNISKKDVKAKIDHINYKIKFSGYDPWDERERKQKERKLSYPLGLAIEEFIADNTEKGNWLPQTKKGYQSRLNLLIKGFGSRKPMDTLTESTMQQWLNDMDVSAITKRSYSKEFNVFFKWCYQNEHIESRWKIGPSNVAQTEIKNTDKIKYITYKQLKRMECGYKWQVRQNKNLGKLGSNFNANRHPAAWWFMFWQALRKTELPKITKKDIKGDKVRIHGKGNRTEWVHMVPPAQQIARKRLKIGSDPLFGIKHPSTLYKNFRKASRLALGKEHSSGLHQLRHGGITHYITMGKPVQFVSKLARHKSIRITLDVYAEVLPSRIEDAFDDVEDKPIDSDLDT